MTDHDPLCPCFVHPDWLPKANCRCDLIAQVGERIAQAIEARGTNMPKGARTHDYYVGLHEAALIARDGGSDE